MLLEVLHCNHSFHRGPILLLAFLVRMGLPAEQAGAFMLWLASVRHIWWGHTAVSQNIVATDHRSLGLLAALEWAVPMQSQPQ